MGGQDGYRCTAPLPSPVALAALRADSACAPLVEAPLLWIQIGHGICRAHHSQEEAVCPRQGTLPSRSLGSSGSKRSLPLAIAQPLSKILPQMCTAAETGWISKRVDQEHSQSSAM